MPRKLFRKYLPDPESLRSSRMVGAFGRWLHHPNLWHLNRRSVPGAVAIGLFAGLVPGPLQMLTALLLAIPLKKNLPVALLVTLYTNPLTIVPLYLLAYAYGQLLLPGERAAHAQPFHFDLAQFAESMRGLGEWAMSLGRPLVVGLLALACTLALVGYVATTLAWRWWAVSAWRARARRRKGQP